jgi:hypothetical protein
MPDVVVSVARAADRFHEGNAGNALVTDLARGE